MSSATIIAALGNGPKTTAQLTDFVGSSSNDVSRTCASLILQGRIKRIDGGSGRGSIAVYALPNFKGQSRAESVRSLRYHSTGRDPDHPGFTVRRDPCFFCGARGDLPCKHDRIAQ